jgi:hypothetical protein
MPQEATVPAGAAAAPAPACARCRATDRRLRADRLLGSDYCVDCHRRNHQDHSRLVELTVPRRIARAFCESARVEIAGPAEELLHELDGDDGWRELQVVRLNAFHALAKQAQTQVEDGGELRLRGPWRTLMAVAAAARGSEMDEVRAALAHDRHDLYAAELHMEALNAFDLLCGELSRTEPPLAR